ncbi:MAG: bifunctional [glutamine synthetase] adenylyltransferase/[glutamine synthetase]-adenylyl-L-tyrosine phosphorylase [Methylobacteriaceae bacterium]|nr:bifunctional [glutamine synthetase] adenylyltransferase/[glutamine synthetase]-adenylyl-L-tyrosine phosphorylase [Methylobacteriaceae bacterium]
MTEPSLATRIRPGAVASAPDMGEPPLGSLGGGPAFAALAAAVAARSPFLRGLMQDDPERLARFAATAPEDSHAALVAAQDALAARFASGEIDRATLVRDLRRNRGAHALLVGLADLGRAWTTDEVVGALSDFADASVRTATEIALAEAAALDRFAPPPGGTGEGSGLVVLALGKHGAGELNYSSDVDLVLFFDPEAPALGSRGEPSRLYPRIAQAIAKLLGERTPDGYVHRVDYRLRPDPASTAAAVSLPAAYVYYETLGQNWERAAMIKARPVAGDLALGERFLADLAPFIWRKYFDFAAIADIHAMKRQIHLARGHGAIAVAGHDIKLGRGGIREIEFFVQTQQLVFGGRHPALRGRRTLDMLEALKVEGWVTDAAATELAGAYRFLRDLEHRLQMVADEQTQRLPTDPGALAGIAALSGFAEPGAFEAALTAQARRVERHYALLFEEGPELAVEAGDLVFTGVEVDPGTVATLRRLGFRDPETAAETVRGWHFGRRPAVTSPRAREVLTELTPALLAALGGTLDPDGALARLDRAFARMPAAVELLTILRSQEPLRTLFADLLGSAPRLAEVVATAPHVLDVVLERDFAAAEVAPEAIEAELAARVGEPADTEEFLDPLRDGARQLQFVAGARLLSGLYTPAQMGAALAAIAVAAIRSALAWTERAFATEHGTVPGARLAVLGLGRLGSADLTATSDLDLLVLYDFDDARRTSDGPRPLDAVVYFTRLTQRLVAALTVPTRRGRLYAVDLRLRPSGTQGPVASQLSAFRAYHESDAELWEQMALVRARPVAGDVSLQADLAQAIEGLLTRPRDRATVFGGVAAMRDLVAREKGEGGPWDMKLSPGGLLDLDFLAQALVLAEGGAEPGLVGLGSGEVFARAAQSGALAAEEARALVRAERLLGDVHHWQRLATAETAPDRESPALLARLATATGFPDAVRLAAELAETRARARAIFDRVLRG